MNFKRQIFKLCNNGWNRWKCVQRACELDRSKLRKVVLSPLNTLNDASEYEVLLRAQREKKRGQIISGQGRTTASTSAKDNTAKQESQMSSYAQDGEALVTISETLCETKTLLLSLCKLFVHFLSHGCVQLSLSGCLIIFLCMVASFHQL